TRPSMELDESLRGVQRGPPWSSMSHSVERNEALHRFRRGLPWSSMQRAMELARRALGAPASCRSSRRRLEATTPATWSAAFQGLRRRSRSSAKCPVMPEGDTILRTARTLERALAGKRVVVFESVYPQLDSRLEA